MAHIEDEDGNKIPYLKKDPKYFYRKIIALYGETESGKSTIIQEIMYLLKDCMPHVIIFAPTNNSNNLYTDKVEKSGIFKKLSLEVLEEINERQKKAVQIYSIANDMSIMKNIFDRTADEKTKNFINNTIKDADKHLQIASQISSDPSIKRAEEIKIKNIRDSTIKKVYKNVISNNKKKLLLDNLNEPEYIAVRFNDFIPDLLLIFDDCASFFVEHKNEPLIKDMFYQGRHDALTSILSFQGDKDIPPTLRRAAHVSFFTTQACANAYVSCKDNGIMGDRTFKKRFEKAASRIFKPDGDIQTYRKLVYLRNDPERLQVTLADSYDDFTMGGLWVRKYLQTIQPKSLTSNNKDLVKEIFAMTKRKDL